METSPTRLTLRYPGTCRECGATLAPGVSALYDPAAKTVACITCVAPADSVHAPTSAAGASAWREYQRRVAKREHSVRTAHPKLGGLILALTNEPQSTTAWRTGAVGEMLLGKRLDALSDQGVRVLHDRQIPGGPTNIDHIAISPAGVFVLDAKRYMGSRPHLRVEGGLLRPRVETLMVGSRTCNALVDGVRKQLGHVRAVLGAAEVSVPVAGMLVFIEGDWPMVGGDFTTGGVRVLWPKKAEKYIRQPGELSANQIELLDERLAAAFPPA